MSSGGKEESPNKSPGKGGKSLELMQQRLMAQSQQEAVAGPPPDAAAGPTPSQPSPTGRPKGKDFATMSANARAQAPPLGPGAPAPAAMPDVGPPGGKHKGKDFSAMASRMGGPPPTGQPQKPMSPNSEQLQKARAAQMQAAARAAAGMPPLDRPTATAVTTVPPNIPAPSFQSQQRSSSIGSAGGSVAAYAGHPDGPPTVVAQQQPHMAAFHAAEQARLAAMAASAASKSQPKSTARAPPQQRRASKTGAAAAAKASSAAATQASKGRSKKTATTAPKKPTPVPTAAEGRVSFISQPAAPHMAPLVGQRIQDLVKELDPNYTIDENAEQQVLQLTDDFLDKVCKQSLRMAQHRGSKTLDVQDVQLVLAKQWGIVVPGLGPPVPKKPKTVSRQSSAGRQRKSTASAQAKAAAKSTKASSSAGAT